MIRLLKYDSAGPSRGRDTGLRGQGGRPLFCRCAFSFFSSRSIHCCSVLQTEYFVHRLTWSVAYSSFVYPLNPVFLIGRPLLQTRSTGQLALWRRCSPTWSAYSRSPRLQLLSGNRSYWWSRAKARRPSSWGVGAGSPTLFMTKKALRDLSRHTFIASSSTAETHPSVAAMITAHGGMGISV
ncbi:hypothetical protein VTK56DRAFT_4109 [Thermocarpiscus australiensis]